MVTNRFDGEQFLRYATLAIAGDVFRVSPVPVLRNIVGGSGRTKTLVQNVPFARAGATPQALLELYELRSVSYVLR